MYHLYRNYCLLSILIIVSFQSGLAVAQEATFGPIAVYPVDGSSFDVASVDLNEDGAPDLVVSSPAVGGVTVLLNDGDGTFGASQLYPVTDFATSVAVGDFNEDGHSDVVAVSDISQLFLLTGAGNGTLNPPTVANEPTYTGTAVDLEVADFNGDSHLDVAALGGVWMLIFSGNGEGQFSRTEVLQITSLAIDQGGLVVGDMNGDAFPDVCFSTGANEIGVLLNDGSGSFVESDREILLHEGFDLTGADFDGDGDMDLAASGAAVVDIMSNDGFGNLVQPPVGSVEMTSVGFTITASDLNMDGFVDLVPTAAGAGFQPLYGDGSGGFTAGQIVSMGLPSPFQILTEDLNADGKPDVVSTDINPIEGLIGVRLNGTEGVESAVALDDVYLTTVNETLSVAAPGVLSNDSGAAPLSVSPSVLPTNGIVDLFNDGSFEYQPNQDFIGLDTFTYLLTADNGQTDQATVYVTVNGAPLVQPLMYALGPELPGDEPYVARMRQVSPNIAYLSTIAESPGGEIVLNFFQGMDLAAYQDTVVWQDPTHYVWYGRLYDYERDFVTIAVNTATSVISATATVNGEIYKVSSAGGVHIAREIDQAGFPEGDDTPEDSVAGKTVLLQPETHSGAEGAAVANPIIDILVVYTDDVARNVDDIDVEIRDIFAKTNVGFRDSGINAEVRLVGTSEVSYAETADGRKDRNRLKDTNDGFLDGVHALRTQTGADVVALMVEDPGDKLCGIAYIMKQNDGSFVDRAFFVVKRKCATDGHTFAHELGHVMGARHDRGVDNTDGSPFDYNHGFGNVADEWRTIMSYNDVCEPGFCTQLNYWSNPDKSYNLIGNGQPGGAMGIDGSADNVRTLSNTAATVAAYSDAEFALIRGSIVHQFTGDELVGIEISGFPDPVITDNAGAFEVLVPIHWSGTITPRGDTLSFVPLHYYVADATGNLDIDFEGIERTVSGHVWIEGTGHFVKSVQIQGFGDPVETDAAGYYEVIVPHDWSGVLVPSLEPYRFDPPAAALSSVVAPVEQNFVALQPPTITGTVSDSETGYSIVAAVLYGFPERVETDFAGNYVAHVPFGWSGTVFPLAAGYNMTPASRTYSGVYDDLAGQDYAGEPGVLADSDWPLVGRNPGRTATGAGPAVKPTLKWSSQLYGGSVTGPVIGPGGMVYTLSSLSGLTRLQAFYMDGTETWFHLCCSYQESSGLGVGAGGVVYMGVKSSLSGRLIAVRPDGNGTLWEAAGPLLHEPTTTSPNLGESGTVYVGTKDGVLVAVNTADGTERWNHDLGDGALTSVALGDDETVYVGRDGWGMVYALDPADGTVIWEFPTSGGVTGGPSVGPDGRVYAATGNGHVHAINADGTEAWTFKAGNAIRMAPAFGPNGEVFVGSDDKYLYALAADGTLRWKYAAGGFVRTGAVVSTHVSVFDPLNPDITQTETVVYFGSYDGFVYAVNAGGTFTPSTPGTLRWKYDTGSPVVWPPALSYTDRTLYVSSGNSLFAFGDGASSGGSGFVQITSLGTIVDPDLLELIDKINIIVALADEGGFGGFGILGGLPDDPCQGGPLFIPDCTDLASGMGTATPIFEVPSSTELQLGFVEAGTALAVAAGDLEGLASTYVTALLDGDLFQGVLAGTTIPDLLAPNPDGLPILLSVYEAPKTEATGTGSPVYFGQFSTDLAAVEITMKGTQEYTFGPLYYGDFSDIAFVEPGTYDIEVAMFEQVAGKRSTAMSASVEVSASAATPTGILLSGFVNPEANLGGPGLAMYRANGDGETEMVSVANDPEPAVPERFVLDATYPNPFNPVTIIGYELPGEVAVRLEVFDVLGRSVAVLVDERQAPGRYEVPFDAHGLAGGVYLYRMTAGSYVNTRTMSLLK